MKRLHHVNGKDRHLHGWRRGKADPRDQHLKLGAFSWISRPSQASVRGKPGLVVEDQGDIGSCTCNSSTTALEFVLKKQKNVDVQLSRLYAYDEVRKFEGTPLTEDSGAEIRDVVKCLAKLGCPTEAHWPYDTKKLAIDPPASLASEALKYRALLYLRCPTIATVEASIAAGFPVIGGFQVPANMMSDECARTGNVKYAPTEQVEGGHAVLFVAYDRAKRLLTFQNSWGVGWGDKGHGTLPYAFMENGLADDMWSLRSAV